jgi:Spy/CpxP family protein refolding chaperone
MKSMRNVLVGTLLAGGALLTAAASFSNAGAADDATTAPPPPGSRAHGEHGPHGFGPERIFSKLGLTADQQASIKSIMTAAKPQMQSLNEKMQANHLKLMQTKPDDPNYGNVVAEVAQANATLASQRTTQAAGLRTQMYAVLTAAQKTQLATLEAQWASQPHHARWGGPHGGGAAPAPVVE